VFRFLRRKTRVKLKKVFGNETFTYSFFIARLKQNGAQKKKQVRFLSLLFEEVQPSIPNNFLFLRSH